MEPEQFIFLVIAAMALISGVGLSLVKLDKNKLKGKIHTFPQMALFRFPAYRWGIVILCITIGVVSLSLGLGWLK